jgi:hypothetical protein
LIKQKVKVTAVHIFIIIFIIFIVVLIINSLTNSRAKRAFNKATDSGLIAADSEYGTNLTQELFNSIFQVVKLHESILLEKRSQLVSIDDYGKQVLDRWCQEFDYFFKHVILSDQDVNNQFSKNLDFLLSTYSKQSIKIPKEDIERVSKVFHTKIQQEAFMMIEQAITVKHT